MKGGVGKETLTQIKSNATRISVDLLCVFVTDASVQGKHNCMSAKQTKKKKYINKKKLENDKFIVRIV